MKLKSSFFIVAILFPIFAQAASLPLGLQAGISQAQVNSWGWNECARNQGGSTASTGSVVTTCSGTSHMAMGVFNTSTGIYDILGAGATSAVTAITYTSHEDDNGGTFLNNWSNDLNWYRTSGYGSWGFTTNTLTDLYSADVLLRNGCLINNGQDECGAGNGLSRGLSFHNNGNGGGDLNSGWAFNTTGENITYITNSYERVWFNFDVADVPEINGSQLGIALTLLLSLVLLYREREGFQA